MLACKKKRDHGHHTEIDISNPGNDQTVKSYDGKALVQISLSTLRLETSIQMHNP